MSNFRIKSCLKGYTLDQDKTVKPSETVKHALERLKKRFDLSNLKIERRSDAIEGAYSFSSISDQLTASGKGLTPEQSQASAIMEFAERYSWLHFDAEKYEGYTVKKHSDIAKGKIPTVQPGYFLNNFIDLREPEQLTAEIVNIPLKWLKALALDDYSDFYYPVNWHNYIFTSNGLATGNAMEEAVIQALCELIERENITRLLRDQRVGNDLDQASITNPLIRKVLDNSRAEGISFVIKEISFDFGVPTFLVYGTKAASKGKLTYKGAGQGTNPNPEKALIRALAEYFESYSLMKRIETEVKIDWGGLVARLPKKHLGFLVNQHPEMIEAKREKVVRLDELKDWSRPDIKDEIGAVLKQLARFGHRVYFVDLTHPELQIPVCRLFIPGFRSVVVSETEDPWFIMSEAYYEAGDEENSRRCLKRSLQRHVFIVAPHLMSVKPRDIFKKNYRETLLNYGGFKKNVYEQLKKFAGDLPDFRA